MGRVDMKKSFSLPNIKIWRRERDEEQEKTEATESTEKSGRKSEVERKEVNASNTDLDEILSSYKTSGELSIDSLEDDPDVQLKLPTSGKAQVTFSSPESPRVCVLVSASLLLDELTVTIPSPRVQFSLDSTIEHSEPTDPVSSGGDLFSPTPYMSFSPQLHASKFRLQKLLEELVDSENTYVLLLQLLKNHYVCHFIGCGTPVVVLGHILTSLINLHKQAVCELNSIPTTDAHIDEILLVFARNILVYIYEEYSNVYEDVLEVVGHEQFPLKTQISGWQNYLEATQPPLRNLDLSFVSLLHRPIARLTKYKLLAESIVGQFKTAKGYRPIQALILLHTIAEKVELVNGNSKAFKDADTTQKVIQMLTVPESYHLQYFGKCLLCGVVSVIWVQNELEVKNCTMAAFLYKSQLVLADFQWYKKVNGRFIVPLCKAKVSTNFKESLGGLYTNYPYTIKLMYEDGFRQYEILIICHTDTEYLHWLCNLKTMIVLVNGQYGMDYTNAEDSGVLQPKSIVPYDFLLLDSSTYFQYKDVCYFKTTVSVVVEPDSPPHDALLAGYFARRDFGDAFVKLKHRERALGEWLLKDVVSPIMSKIGSSRRIGLRKSFSWSYREH